MGRNRHIPQDANPTTISLTRRQQIVFQKLQVKRQEKGLQKPTLTEVMMEGFEILLKNENWDNSELELAFPKSAPRKATVRVMARRRR
jgi:hypothetical protein